MPYDDSSIFIFLKKIGYKFMCMSSYVCPSTVIKRSQQIHQTPSYINVKVYIQPNWQGLVQLVNASKAIEFFLKVKK
jgi:hypothetical protein